MILDAANDPPSVHGLARKVVRHRGLGHEHAAALEPAQRGRRAARLLPQRGAPRAADRHRADGLGHLPGDARQRPRRAVLRDAPRGQRRSADRRQRDGAVVAARRVRGLRRHGAHWHQGGGDHLRGTGDRAASCSTTTPRSPPASSCRRATRTTRSSSGCATRRRRRPSSCAGGRPPRRGRLRVEDRRDHRPPAGAACPRRASRRDRLDARRRPVTRRHPPRLRDDGPRADPAPARVDGQRADARRSDDVGHDDVGRRQARVQHGGAVHPVPRARRLGQQHRAAPVARPVRHARRARLPRVARRVAGDDPRPLRARVPPAGRARHVVRRRAARRAAQQGPRAGPLRDAGEGPVPHRRGDVPRRRRVGRQRPQRRAHGAAPTPDPEVRRP